MVSGLRVVVTGAGSGLGRAFCLELARRRARLIASDVSPETLERTVAEVRERGGEAHATLCDVSRLDDVRALAVAADTRLGGVDLLINNAGVGVSGRVGSIPIDDWRWAVEVNLWGVVHGCHVFVPRFLAQHSGAVLNVSSAAGLIAPPEMAPYNVSKAAVVALSETLFQELSGEGVSVTVVCPTFFRSNFIGASRNQDAKMAELGDRLVRRSRVDADRVARMALDGVSARRLYVFAGAEGRWLWRLKRLAPAFYLRLAPSVARRLLRSGDRSPRRA